MNNKLYHCMYCQYIADMITEDEWKAYCFDLLMGRQDWQDAMNRLKVV